MSASIHGHESINGYSTGGKNKDKPGNDKRGEGSKSHREAAGGESENSSTLDPWASRKAILLKAPTKKRVTAVGEAWIGISGGQKWPLNASTSDTVSRIRSSCP